jgi:hypothetical protein
MRVQLSEEDRAKYGAPEWLDVPYGTWGLKIVDDLESEAGLTLEDFENGLWRKRKNEDGEEIASPRPVALVALAWLALRSAKIRIPWDDFDISPIGLKIDWESGKAEEADPDSVTANTSS